jgi:hypothetical protein
MNIFMLHENPETAVTPMYNKHVVKMLLETAQLLCTAHHAHGNGDNVPYKQSHLNHPSSIWVRQNTANYNWTYVHFLALCEEYTRRYGKIHMSYTKCADVLYDAPSGMNHSDTITPMPQCMPDQYKVDGDSVKAYRNYYLGEKYLVANKNEKVLTSIFGYKI